MNEQPQRVAHPLNADGDFYVEKGLCLACTAPEHEAPELMSHEDDYHCYFKRQPRTPDEVDKAIRAVVVGCCGAVRYRGTDPTIIERVVALGGREDCDDA
jgi:hypothetical protein